MSDTSKDDGEELLDSTDPLDDPVIEKRFEPQHLDEGLEEGAAEAEEAGVGGLLPPDHQEE